MKKIIGIENLKDEFRKAKLKCGDHRGLGKNRFKLAEKFGIHALQIYFDAVGGGGEGMKELTADCYGQDGQGDIHAYTMGGLVDEIKNEKGEFEINLICLNWNEYRNDAKRKEIERFLYSNQ